MLAANSVYPWVWEVPEDRVFVPHASPAGPSAFDPEEAIGGLPIEAFVRVFHEEDRARALGDIRGAVASGESYAADYRVPGADGWLRWFAARGRAEYGEDGAPLRFPGVLVDVTERKRAEGRLALQHAVTRLLFQPRPVEDVVPEVLRLIGERLGWSFGVYWRVDEATETLRCKGVWRAEGFSAEGFERLSLETRFGRGIGLPGRAWETGEPEWVDELCSRADLPRVPAAAAEGLRSALAAPVRAGARVLGVMEFFGDRSLAPDGELLRTVAALGDLLGSYAERRRVEASLGRSENRYRSLVEASTDMVWVTDAEGRFTYEQPDWADFTGQSFEDYRDFGWLGAIHPDDRGRTQEAWLEHVRRRAPIDVEYRARRRDGEWRHMHVRAAPVSEDGRIVEWVGVEEDVTERKRAEERIRFLDDLTLSLQPLADPDEIMATTARVLGEHLDADRCAYAEVEGDQDHFTITGDYARGVASIIGRFAMSGFGSEALRLMRRNEPYVVSDSEGDERVTQDDLPAYRATEIRAVVCVPLHKAGRFVAGMAVHQKTPRGWTDDEVELITAVVERCWESLERARAERRLRESEERFRAIFGQATSGIAQTDLSGRFVLVNERYCGIVGRARDELLGSRLLDLVHPGDRPEGEEAFGRAVGEGREFELEQRYVRGDGSVVWVHDSGSVVRDGSGNPRYFLTVTEDVTERKRAEEERERLLRREREISLTLQRSLLPPSLPEIPGVELAARYVAAGEGMEVGGDFYDAFSVPGDGWGLVVGDVTGKGPEAAALTSLAHYTIRAAAARERGNPIEVVAALNEEILRRIGGERLFTAVYGEMERAADGWKLEMATGGHLPPLVSRSDGRVESFEPAGMILGATPHPRIGGWKVDLNPGDAVMLYTDGATEARDRGGAFFGEERLKDLCARCAGLTAEEIATKVESTVVAFQDGNPRDDVALLVLKVAHA